MICAACVVPFSKTTAHSARQCVKTVRLKRSSVEITVENYRIEGERRYGPARKNWVFKCPVCGIKTKAEEWVNNGAEDQAAFSCIGRSMKTKKDMFDTGKKGPCNYAGGGLFRLNPIKIKFTNGSVGEFFDFADDPLIPETENEE